MKFDVVIGNPPYQHPTNKSIKIWTKIVCKVMAYIHVDAHVCFVTPNTWLRRPTARAFDKFTKAVSNGLCLVETQQSHHFDVGENIGYWVYKNNYNGTAVVDKVDIGVYEQTTITTNDVERLVYKLTTLFLKGKTLRDIKIIDFSYATSTAIKNGKMSNTPTQEFDTPVFITAARTCYTKKEYVTDTWKLILNKSGYYYSDTNDKYMVVPTTTLCGVGEGGVGVPTQTYEEALDAKKFYSKKIFRFYIDNEKTAGFNTGLFTLPVLPFTTTDEELYKHFNLTKEEIKLIEDYTKV